MCICTRAGYKKQQKREKEIMEQELNWNADKYESLIPATNF